MKLYILEKYDAEFPIIHYSKLSRKDTVDGYTLANWLNHNLVNKYLDDNNGYTIDDNGNFEFVNDDTLSDFRKALINPDKGNIEIYIYGDCGTTYLILGKIKK